MWTVSACSVTFCVSCERKQNPLSIPHWILLICADHALILRYRAASPLPQETLQIDIWQLGGEGGRTGVVFHFFFVFPTVNMWPSATHLGLEGTFLLWLWMLTAESIPLKLLLTTVSVTNREMNKEKECLSHFSALCTLSVLEGK